MLYKKLARSFDWWLFLLVISLCLVGLIVLRSALAGVSTLQGEMVFKKQLFWYFSGLALMMLILVVDYKLFQRFAHLIYVFSMVLLILVFFIGKNAGGAQRWLDFGFFSVQPSEIAKLAVVIIVANLYSKLIKRDGLTIRDIAEPFGFTAVPFFLVVRQPDLGTAMIIVLVVLSMTAFVKLEKKTLLFSAFSCVTLAPILWFFLRNYQKNRVLVFLDPDKDPLGSGYHIIQSKIAIGSGMLTGKGFMKGTQNFLSFLPEQHTDFIFSVLAEEWGFVGAFMVLMIFLATIVRGILIASHCRDTFGTILAIGIISIIAWQVFINIGMVMGLVPVVGVTLPFISYGGSSLLTTMCCVGILLNISVREC